MAYRIEYSQEAIEHLRYLSSRERTEVFDAIDIQLPYEPYIETKNRKLMRPNPLSVYELRVQNLRVYFDIEEIPEKLVIIRAIGKKEVNRVYIAGKEIKL